MNSSTENIDIYPWRESLQSKEEGREGENDREREREGGEGERGREKVERGREGERKGEGELRL